MNNSPFQSNRSSTRSLLSPQDGGRHSPAIAREPVACERPVFGMAGRLSVVGDSSTTTDNEELLGPDLEQDWKIADIVAALKNGYAICKKHEESVRNTLAWLHRTGKITFPTRGRYRAVRLSYLARYLLRSKTTPGI